METNIFNDLIGVSAKVRPECNRLDAVKLTTSKSGLFLDKIEGIDLNTDAPCNIYDWMLESIDEAGKHFYTDLLAGLGDINNKYSLLNSYAGLLGETEARNRLYNITTATFELKTKDISGGRISIKRVGLVLPLSTIVDIRLYKGSELLNTWSVTTTANTASYFTLINPVNLNTDGSVYRFEYTVPASSDIYSNRLNCGCGTSWTIISKYIDNRYSDSSNGIILDVTINCNSFHVVDKNFEQNTNVFNVLAFGLRYKAGELLIEKIISSGQISRFTMLERNHLWGKRDHFRVAYEERINWLLESGIDRSLSGCYVCNTGYGARYATIRL